MPQSRSPSAHPIASGEAEPVAIGAWRRAGPCCAPPRSASGPSPRAGAGSYRSPVLLHAFCRQCGRHPPLHADVRTARRRGRRGRRGTRHGRHRRDGRDGRRRRRGRHNQLPSLRGRSAPRTGQLYHGQTGLTAVASCRSMPCRLRSKRFIFFCLFGKLWIKNPPLSSGITCCFLPENSPLRTLQSAFEKIKRRQRVQCTSGAVRARTKFEETR